MAEQHNRLQLHPFYLLIDLQISLLSVFPFFCCYYLLPAVALCYEIKIYDHTVYAVCGSGKTEVNVQCIIILVHAAVVVKNLNI